MNAEFSQQYRQYNQRSLITGITAACVITAVQFGLHDWYHELTGWPDRVLDTIGVIAIIVTFIVTQRILSARFYDDIRYGMESILQDERKHCPANAVCKRVCVPEMRDVPRYTQVLRGHLDNVSSQTEQAALDVTMRLQTIDEVVGELTTFVATASHESESMSELSVQRIAENRELIGRLEAFIQTRIGETARDEKRAGAAGRERK
jgi:methyl-accepting chemotaxis protein